MHHYLSVNLYCYATVLIKQHLILIYTHMLQKYGFTLFYNHHDADEYNNNNNIIAMNIIITICQKYDPHVLKFLFYSENMLDIKIYNLRAVTLLRRYEITCTVGIRIYLIFHTYI